MIKMLKSKKGFEFPHSIWFVFITCVLIIFSLVIIYSFMTNICPTIQYKLFNMKYNTLASKLIYSDCMAYEADYPGPLGKQKIVYAGMLDRNKLKDTVRSCANLVDSAGAKQNYGMVIWTLTLDSTKSWKETEIFRIGDLDENHYPKNSGRIGYFLVRIRNTDGSVSTGKVKLMVNMDVPTFKAECY